MHNESSLGHVLNRDFLDAEDGEEGLWVGVARNEILDDLNKKQNVEQLNYRSQHGVAIESERNAASRLLSA